MRKSTVYSGARRLVSVCLTLLCLQLHGRAAIADPELPVRFRATNATTRDALGLDIADLSDEAWGWTYAENGIPAGQSALIQTTRTRQFCRQDIVLLFKNGSNAIWHNVDVCRIHALTLHLDDRTGRTWVSNLR